MDDQAGHPTTALDNQPATTGERVSLKDGDLFMVADMQGDVCAGADGLFFRDTRILSRWMLLFGDKRPSPLSHDLSPDNAVFTFHGANRAMPPVGERATPRGVIHVERKRVLSGERLFERVHCANYGLDTVMLPLSYEYAADFSDMFEVRGAVRPARGTPLQATVAGRHVVLAYNGLDGVRRESAIIFSEPPWRISESRADFMFYLSPGQSIDLCLEVGGEAVDTPSRERFDAAVADGRATLKARRVRGATISCPDHAFSAWIEQSRADIALLTTDFATGPYPCAGIPWFSTPFGRDGIITAWQMLWLDPSLAKGVLTYLAANQAHETSTFRDSQPGKIMHETRKGEMAALKEVPFGLYYGGVDTTPLFVALAGAYLRRTDDVELIRALEPALDAAMGWLEHYADSNGDGLIDYQRGADTGLSNQGWKDSEDSVFHADGRMPSGPIALVEPQGYAFAAFRTMAAIARRLGRPEEVEGWTQKAWAMRDRVEQRFWMEHAGFYGLAIDGEGALCTPHASNPGHLLFVGLPGRAHAAKVTERLLSADFDSGWGIRTLACGSVRFNPMSYHNGSVWPHDTSLCVAGMARYGERAGPAKIIRDLFIAAQTFDDRMPELICGFEREGDQPPIAYPVACAPQAWAAGSVFLMLQACLGLTINAAKREVRLVRPILPEGVGRLVLDGIDVGGARVGFTVEGQGEMVAVQPAQTSESSIRIVLER